MSVLRRLGEGTSAHERDLEQGVSRVPQWRGRDIRYAPMAGGLTNQNWIVDVENDSRRYFVKVPGAGSEGLEVTEFLEGYRACTNADFADPAIQGDVVALYSRLHAGIALGTTKTIFDMIEEHIDQGRQLGSHFPADMPWIEHRYRQAKAAFLASGLDLVPCFNDPMPGNFLVSDDMTILKPMKLIDYEYASNNERSYELGVLFAEMFFDEKLIVRLVEQYAGTARQQFVARVMVSRALADVKWATWAVVNRKLKDWDFDYQKYGVWKYRRAHDVMYDARWDNWLRTV